MESWRPDESARHEFLALVRREPIPLARGALLIAREEHPTLDVDHYLAKIAALAERARPYVAERENTVEKIEVFSHLFSEEEGFKGNRENYDDPRNSFLNEVLDRRLGIPITLSVIYLEVGRRLGLNLYGVPFPGHFLVKAVDRVGELIIDPFNGGRILSWLELGRLLAKVSGTEIRLDRRLLRAASTRHILARMLRNLKIIYLRKGDLLRALAALDRILALQPHASDELLERALVYEQLECFTAALQDFKAVLKTASDHPAFDEAREGVIRLTRRVMTIS